MPSSTVSIRASFNPCKLERHPSSGYSGLFGRFGGGRDHKTVIVEAGHYLSTARDVLETIQDSRNSLSTHIQENIDLFDISQLLNGRPRSWGIEVEVEVELPKQVGDLKSVFVGVMQSGFVQKQEGLVVTGDPLSQYLLEERAELSLRCNFAGAEDADKSLTRSSSAQLKPEDMKTMLSSHVDLSSRAFVQNLHDGLFASGAMPAIMNKIDFIVSHLNR